MKVLAWVVSLVSPARCWRSVSIAAVDARRIVAATGVALSLGLLVALALPGAAIAHAGLVATDPPDGSRLDQNPGTITLRFNEEIPVDLATVSLLSPDGPADLPVAAAGPNGIRASLNGDEQGQVSVSFRVTSADGHPIAGETSFVVTETSQPPDEAEEQSDQGSGGRGEPLEEEMEAPGSTDSESGAGTAAAASDESGGWLVGFGVAGGFAVLLAILLAVVVLARRAARASS